MRKNGFTLVELAVSTAVLSVISLLAYVVLSSSMESAALAQAKSESQSNLRDVMGALTSELRLAYTARTIDALVAPEDTEAIRLGESEKEIIYQIPVPTGGPDMATASLPIMVTLYNEDDDGDGILDSDEDTNEDGALNRRVVRIQGGEETILAAANDISDLQFELLSHMDTGNDRLTRVRIRLESVKHYGSNKEKTSRAELESIIDIKN